MVATLSLVRPSALPFAAPQGQSARTIKRDQSVNHPGFGLSPQRVVTIYRSAESGYPAEQCDLFDDVIENDPHLRSLFEQRAQAVAGKPWVIQADGAVPESETAAAVLAEALRKLPMTEVLEHQLTFNRHGFAVSEIDWGTVEAEGRTWFVPIHFAHVPARRFRIDPVTDELRLITEANREGETLTPGKFWITRRSGSRCARSGLMRTALWPAMWKRFSTRDWVIFAEKFGLPLPVVSYEDGTGPGGTGLTDDTARDVAAEIAQNIGNDGAAVAPKSIDVKFHEAGRDGNAGGVHGGLIAHCNAEMSKLINGSTLSNDNAGSGGASYALGEVHASVRWDNVVYDAERIQETFRTQPAAYFMAFNAVQGPTPLLKIQVVRDLDPKQRVDVAKTMVNDLGASISLAQLNQELGFREPRDESDKAAGAIKSAPPGAAPAAPSPGEVAP